MSLGNGVKLTWIGHASFILETPGGKRALIDPWITGNPVPLQKQFNRKLSIYEVQAVLASYVLR